MDTERIAALVRPLATAAGLSVYDVEQHGATLRVSIDGDHGVPIDALEQLSREISLTLDEHDVGSGSYTLEVSTPGVERRLRRAEHHRAAIGELVTVKTVPGPEGRRRYRGVLVEADDAAIEIDDDEQGRVRLGLDQIESARTVFEWGPAPKPGSAGSGSHQRPRSVS